LLCSSLEPPVCGGIAPVPLGCYIEAESKSKVERKDDPSPELFPMGKYG